MSLKAPATIEAVIACSAYPASGYLNWPAHMQYADVAAAAAEAMDGYMLFTQKLVARLVPLKVGAARPACPLGTCS